MRSILAFLSDTHGGCKFGLCNPDTILFDEDENGNQVAYHPRLTATQRFLWDQVYMPQLRQVFELANGDPLYVNHAGDETHGNKYPSELVSTRIADQIAIAAANLSPWYEYDELANVTLEAGTGAHSFLEATSTILVVKQLAAEHGKTEICNHGLIDYQGVMVDAAHHGPFPGSRNWLKGNVARLYLLDLMQRELLAGCKPPRLVIRAHYHEPVHEYLERCGCVSELYVLPSYCGLGEHGSQATKSADRITWGMTVFEIIDGEIRRCWKLHQTEDIRTRRVYPIA